MSDPLDLAVRAYTPEPPDPHGATQRKQPVEERFPSHALILDTETTVDAAQSLNFGVWRYCRVEEKADGGVWLRCVQEGVFYADDLPDRDPGAVERITQYARSRRADVGSSVIDAVLPLLVMSQSQFLERIVARVAYRLRGAVVAFNFPFDISRLAWQAGFARNRRPDRRDPFDGGFSLTLFSYLRDGKRREGLHRPRIAIKPIDSKRALKGFRRPESTDQIDRIPEGAPDGQPDAQYQFRGHFIDLRTLVFALTDRGHTLESACDAYGVGYEKRPVVHGEISEDYITYCREDVKATQDLCQAAVTEFLKHPIPLQATRAYSPATIGKSYLREMGVVPPRQRQRFDPVLLGHCMSAYYGGRAEVRIRNAAVPVAYCDFKSMYPTVCALTGLWDLLTARIDVQEAAVDVRELLARVSADECFDQGTWREMVGFALIAPDNDVLPVRGRYGPGPSFGIGVNHLTSREPMWFAIPDLIASTLLTGKPPTVLRAVRFTAGDRIAGLEPVSLLGATPVDPGARDFFLTVVEQRTLAKENHDTNLSQGLKTLANATSYGIYAQMTRRKLNGGRTEPVTIYGFRDEPFARDVSAPEEPGDFTFPPFAAVITAGARLLLALTEHEVTSRGGSYVFCDTDSMAIVATPTGGLVRCPGGPERLQDGRDAVRALSHAQVDEIRDRFASLNPHDSQIVRGSILELEDENYDRQHQRLDELMCLAVSAKRYTFYTDTSDGPRLIKPSRHGLGHLVNPTDPRAEDRDWIDQVWQGIVRRHLELPTEAPEWVLRPAVGRLSISSHHLYRLMRAYNEGRGYPEQIKPFGFLNIAFVGPTERPAGRSHMTLIAPFSTDPHTRLSQPWIDRNTAERIRITLEPSSGEDRPGRVTVKSYRDTLAEHATHPEYKSADPDGRPCNRRTTGLLRRRHVEMRTITHIGKEANSLDDATAGLITDPREIQNLYDDSELLRFEAETLPVLRTLGVREVARRTGFAPSAVSRVLRGLATPKPASRLAYERACAALARD